MTPDLAAPAKPLAPPKGLARDELSAWAEHVERVRELGIESRVDVGSMEVLVRMYCRARRAEVELAKGMTMMTEANGRIRKPEVLISESSWKVYIALCGQFGLTPAARAKLGPTSAPRERAGDVPEHLRDVTKRGRR
jgi:P27 family predicted phage terminase small subunit